MRYGFYDHCVEGGVQTGPVTEAGRPILDELRAWLEERSPGTATPPEDAASRRAREQTEKELRDELLRQTFGEEWPGPTEPAGDSDEDGTDTPRRWELTALEVASRLSVSPNALGRHTTVRGTGVLAVPAGRPDSRRYGALPV